MFRYEDSESEEEEVAQVRQSQGNNEQNWSDTDDDSEENRRVVKPLEKFDNSMKVLLDTMQSLSDQNDFTRAYGKFQEIQKLVTKNQQLIRVRGPSEYYLIHMNRFLESIAQADKSALKNYEGKDKKDNNKKFTRFKNDLKKKLQPFANQLELFKKENDIWAEPKSDEEDSVQDDDKEEVGDGFDEDDFSDWSADEESDSNDPDPGTGTGRIKPDMYKREFWLKKEYQPEYMRVKDDKSNNARMMRQKKREEAAKKRLLQKEQGKGLQKEQVWDDKRVRKLIEGVLNAKGSIDRSERRKFNGLLEMADSKCQRPQWKMLTKLLLIENLLDLYTPPRCLKRGAWNTIVEIMNKLIDLLTEHPYYRLHVRGLRKLELNEEEKERMREAESSLKNTDNQSVFGHGLADAESMLKKEQVIDDDHVEGLSDEFWWLRGNLHAVCTRLSDDLILAFKKSDIKNDEYEERIADKELLVGLCEKCQTYVREVTNHRMHELMFRHLFVKLTFEDYDEEWDMLKSGVRPTYRPFQIRPDTRVLRTVKDIFREVKTYEQPDAPKTIFGALEEELEQFNVMKAKIKWETVLYCVHHLALHHRYELARDILSASGLGKESTMGKSEISIQILYNRTVARLAIAAFTHEDWHTSMVLLQRLYVTGKIKELLAQGVKTDLRWKHNKTPEEIAQEQQEKQRMVPQHTFIDLDLLESVHYVSSLFFEMKAILQSDANEARVANRSFRRQWEYRQKREFLAPPENTRDTILEAGARMLKGDWKKCLHHLRSLKCWEQFHFAEEVMQRVEKRAKAECLRCYLMSSSKHFSDIELSVLGEKFEMEAKEVIRLCSQFIVDQDIKASIDLPGGYLIIHESLPTQFETSATEFDHRLTSFFNAIKETGDMFKINAPGVRAQARERNRNRADGRSAQSQWRN